MIKLPTAAPVKLSQTAKSKTLIHEYDFGVSDTDTNLELVYCTLVQLLAPTRQGHYSRMAIYFDEEFTDRLDSIDTFQRVLVQPFNEMHDKTYATRLLEFKAGEPRKIYFVGINTTGGGNIKMQIQNAYVKEL